LEVCASTLRPLNGNMPLSLNVVDANLHCSSLNEARR